jgi:acyl carrier protein
MAATLGRREQARLEAQGIKPIQRDRGFQVLGELLTQNATQVGVLPINWPQFIRQFPPDRQLPMLAVVSATTATIVQPKSAFRQKVDLANAGDRQVLLLEHLRQQIAKVLNMSSVEAIDPQLGFIDLGMDSLMAVELSNRLRSSLECPVSAAIAFDYPTIESLVDYFDQTIAAQLTTTVAATPVAVPAVPPIDHHRIPDRPQNNFLATSRAALESLSDHEAEALLIRQLEAMRY